MRVLIVDDMQTRHYAFRNCEKTKEFSVVVSAYNYEDAIELLSKEKFDLAFLDHDLSISSIMCDPDNCKEKTGTDLANWIIANLSKARAPMFILHSHNFAGRQKMFHLLTDAGYIVKDFPFNQVIKWLS